MLVTQYEERCGAAGPKSIRRGVKKWCHDHRLVWLLATGEPP
jgi:hypothetical protein